MKNASYVLGMFCLCMTTIVCHAQTDKKPYFTVQGEVKKPLKLTTDDLTSLKQAEIKAKDKEGKEHVYLGVTLVDILAAAGVTLGGELRGGNLTKIILIKALDGYEVVFSLAEIDPEFTSQTILVAYQVDGEPLPKGEGPFRIVAPGEKKPARWIREINAIKVIFAKE